MSSGIPRAADAWRPGRFTMDRMDTEDIAAAAAGLRAVLDEIGDGDSDLIASAATRHRIEGAALALEALADC